MKERRFSIGLTDLDELAASVAPKNGNAKFAWLTSLPVNVPVGGS